MSLYQSYRPKNFTDVVGQDFVKKVLANACKTGKLNHGYIFFGFHGIGKTTLARIFAEGVNCTDITPEGNPCHACPNCIAYDNGKMIDVIEIDAASYTGVDNIREIIDHAKFTPTQGKYKVYIIDEVHMLSKGAFNALLKTLEEPPAHVIFLLATTEIGKVPDTILSRVIRFDLTKISAQDMSAHLREMCKKEGIKYQEEAMNMIIHRARGSLRDALTMLEKCIFEGEVTTKYVEEALHLVSHAFLQETFDACVSGNAQAIQGVLDTLDKEATDVRQFAAQITEWIVEHISESFEKNTFPVYQELFELFTRVYIQSRQVAVPMDVMKMALFERVKSGNVEKKTQDKEGTDSTILGRANSPKLESEAPETLPPEVSYGGQVQMEKLSRSETQNVHSDGSPPSLEGQNDLVNNESSIFSKADFFNKIEELGIKKTLLPLLKTADITLQDETITILTTDFCKSKCEETGTRMILEQAGKSFGSNTIVIEAITSPSPDESISDSTELAKNIFA